MTENVRRALDSLRTIGGVALIAFAAAAGLYLISQHTQHVFGALPYLLILACPLVHFFMHRGHGHHRHPVDRPKDGP